MLFRFSEGVPALEAMGYDHDSTKRKPITSSGSATVPNSVLSQTQKDA